MTQDPETEPQIEPGSADQPQQGPALEGSGYAFRRFDDSSQTPPKIEEDHVDDDNDDKNEDVLEVLSEPTYPPAETAALTITIQSWATPVVGLVMLILGLVGGFFVRPYILPAEPTAGTQASSQTSDASPTQAQASPEDRAALMEALLPRVRHFTGDPDAPITLIEFSDFQ